MKIFKIIIALTALIFSVTSFAQTAPPTSSTVDVIEIAANSLEEGTNRLQVNAATGSTLSCIVIDREIKGFSIEKANGKSFRLPIQVKPSTAGTIPPTIGCPDGWDSEIICYTHPKYDVTVCYHRCTPTTITIGLPSGW